MSIRIIFTKSYKIFLWKNHAHIEEKVITCPLKLDILNYTNKTENKIDKGQM